MNDRKFPVKQFLLWLPAAVWMGLMAYLATESFAASWSQGVLRSWIDWLHLPVDSDGLQRLNSVGRKAAHVFEFFVLGTLLYPALRQYRHRSEWQVLVWVLVGGGLWAVCNEVQQSFTVTRTPSVLDVWWDFGGVVISQLLVFWQINMQQALRPVSKS